MLQLTWLAFFISYLVWFNHTPLMASIQDTFALTQQEIKALLIMNVALTIPARIVIGIRMIGEWFPARQLGIAEGIYGGWGNFGSAAAALSLPTIAFMFGGDEGWRYAKRSSIPAR